VTPGDVPVGGPAGTLARRRRASGERGEALAARHLEALGWTVLARRVRVGRDEIDLVAVDPGPPSALVIVEVRTRVSGRFGSPEESVDRRKVARLYRAAAALRAIGTLPAGTPIPALPWRVDLVAVDDAPAIGPGAGGPAFRHVRALEPR
jgi:putative endonuclease